VYLDENDIGVYDGDMENSRRNGFGVMRWTGMFLSFLLISFIFNIKIIKCL
jgi:hypothetical protein